MSALEQKVSRVTADLDRSPSSIQLSCLLKKKKKLVYLF